MANLNNNQRIFFELLKAGLFPYIDTTNGIDNALLEGVDWVEVYKLSQEQSVQGLVLQGLEWYNEHQKGCVEVPQTLLLQWIGQVQMIEHKNQAMNEFVEWIIKMLRKESIYTLLVKGQGVAQCYEKPLWRAPGDVDLLLSNDNYESAKRLLMPIAKDIEDELVERKHVALTINGWPVELHGTLRTGLWNRLERVMDSIKSEAFNGGNVRTWDNGGTQVFLLMADEDVVFVFAHILQHFYIEGIGLRQICDWCRLLYCYREKLDLPLLESRIRAARMMNEWKAFGSFAVEYLGLPVEAMPLYDSSGRWRRKARRVQGFVLETGNFGRSKDMSYKQKYPKLIRYGISFVRRGKEGFMRFRLFHWHGVVMWWRLMVMGAHGLMHI